VVTPEGRRVRRPNMKKKAHQRLFIAADRCPAERAGVEAARVVGQLLCLVCPPVLLLLVFGVGAGMESLQLDTCLAHKARMSPKQPTQ
jgi:hypothetical protein